MIINKNFVLIYHRSPEASGERYIANDILLDTLGDFRRTTELQVHEYDLINVRFLPV